SDMERMLAAGPAIAALILILMGQDYRRMFRPLPKYLFATGTPMDAVVLSADAAGPSLEIDGASYVRTSYLLEVSPPGGEPYEVEIRTFGGPSIMVENVPLTVYVDPRKPSKVCPDWSTLGKRASNSA